MNRVFSRRTVLRGAGVALTLPWLESLLPRAARAQAMVRKRYLPIYLPNGSAEFWKPASPGSGASWKLSSILEPLTPYKAKLNVLTNMENGTSFNANRSSSVEPSHGRQPGAWLTCSDPGVVRAQLNKAEANIPSIDQRIAKFLKNPNIPIDSLAVGLSTTSSFCDGQPCSNSRTISWDYTNQPMYKLMDPLDVFNKLAGVVKTDAPMGSMPDAEAQRRVALNQSVLDAVLANTNATKLKLGSQDQQRLDEFLTAVREVEVKATTLSGGMGGVVCKLPAAPTISSAAKPIHNDNFARGNTAGYNKGTHADVMNDLIALAFQCDATRVITYMLEDERSEFAYSHVTKRTFTTDASVQASGTCGEYHNGGQHGDPNEFASITWWNVGKVAELCKRLDAVMEEDGKTILDNTLIMFGSAMHGSNHACNQLPLVLIGGGGGSFKTDQHVNFDNRWLRDLHHTVMTRMYGMSGDDVDKFGVDRPNVPRAEIKEILV